MAMGSVLVRLSRPCRDAAAEAVRVDNILSRTLAGWYDSVYDPETGAEPCIFTSITPVR